MASQFSSAVEAIIARIYGIFAEMSSLSPADNPVDEDVRIMKLRLQVDKTPTDAARLDFLTTRERMLTRILNKLNYPQA